jgi:hypothetical protein
MSATTFIIRPQPLVAPLVGPRRAPPRPAELQEADYLERYDDTTLLYDVFRVENKVLAIGPPAGSLSGLLTKAYITDGRGKRVGRLRPEGGLDRLERYWAAGSRGIEAHLALRTLLTDVPITVQDDEAKLLGGRRAVMTVSKDNDLAWIRDWGRWYAQRHGADALVIYDNASTAYSLEELNETIAAIDGVAVAVVVDWSFKYGPIGHHPFHLHDSNYAQHGAIEHARWRLLREATGFLGVDIDELVADPDGRSVFEAVSEAASGCLELPGIWTYPAPGTPTDRPPRHSDSAWIKVLPADAPSPPKWCVVPSRLPRYSQLTVHSVRKAHSVAAPAFQFWHLLAISTNWYGGRARFRTDPETYRADEELEARHSGLRTARSSQLTMSRPSNRARVVHFARGASGSIRQLVRRGRDQVRAAVRSGTRRARR